MATKRSKKLNVILDLIESVTDLGLKLGGLGLLLVVGYIIYGLVNKQGFGSIGSMPAADQARLLGVVTIAGKVLWVSGAICAVCVGVRYYVEEALGYMMSLLGVLLYLAMPYLLALRFSGGTLFQNPAISIIVGSARSLGMTLFVLGGVLIVRDLLLRISAMARKFKVKIKEGHDSGFLVGAAAMEVEQEAYQPTAYAKCWQMPYCRGFVRNVCPAHAAGRPCWQMKSGCMCDGDIILKALSSCNSEGRMFHKELQYRIGEVPTKSALTNAQKRQRCRRCVIYEFHQGQKYKLVSPLIFPFVVGLMWITYPRIEVMVRAVIESTDRFMKIVSFVPQSPGAGDMIASGTPEVILVVSVVWLGLMAVSYMLRLVEWCIFDLQI